MSQVKEEKEEVKEEQERQEAKEEERPAMDVGGIQRCMQKQNYCLA